MTAGHVFIVQGDADQLACDVRLSADRLRPRAGASVDGHLDWVHRSLAETGESLPTVKRTTDRALPLVAIPIAGAAVSERLEFAGEVLAGKLPLLQQAARDGGFDVAWVAGDGPTFAAAQAARHRQTDGDPWPDLDDELRSRADDLAGRASRGELALFLGAGVGAAAGLPLWGELLDKLAAKGGMDEAERDTLRQLNPLDQAAVIERRLGGPTGLQNALRDLFTAERYALPHALLAALPVHEVVTTNYDQLFEMAWEAAGRRPSILPYLIRADDGWVLKMHGSVTHPKDLVLTRGHFIGFEEHHAALAGIVQTLLVTRHVLFVGFSLNDDNFHRIADAVRRVVRNADAPEGGDPQAFGTALMLERSELVEELWEKDLYWVCTAGSENEDTLVAARRLELFLDYLLYQTRSAAHLLDERYVALLTDGERELRDALLPLADKLSEVAWETPGGGPFRKLLEGLGWAGRSAPRLRQHGGRRGDHRSADAERRSAMADPKPPRPHEMPNAGAEDVPPGATRAAQDRETTPPARGPNDPPGKKPRGEPRTIDDPRGGENMPR